ncbi:type II toxin-antitoxin system HicB family antitoxin [Leptolyngbya sp. CCNP1308]|uniref:type II toxin-antitoxin system HicB family antitoxin n=1 Tax=Leptolyngbya sp. CCNP1308 TaxID=3110255 RepID=UPI002B1EC529|nr:type II toxin-antitoxin system HicB family antitoxin [Leptolyngbya sp. CCNP1308]MEA5450445.1 type II toxin-antitoxin system HicB family antitoxin [Leptolyngbya sp. CCNP1308]
MYDCDKTLQYSPMLARYIHAAMRQATYELLEDGTFYGEIPPHKGVWSNADSLKACREALQDSLEEWIILGLRLEHGLPILDSVLW